MADSRGLLARLLNDICEEIGVALTIHDDFGRFGTITYQNGRTARFKGTSLDINPLGAFKISDDKDYTATLLRAAGLNAPEGRVVISPTYKAKLSSYSETIAEAWDPFGDAQAAFKQFGFPLFIKPNIGSEGFGVQKVSSESDALEHLGSLFQRCDTVLIQPPIEGRDYRLVMLDGKVRLAYERVPLSITGDGISTVQALIAECAQRVAAQGRALNLSALMPLIEKQLAKLDVKADSVLADEMSIALLQNANLTTGGASKDVLDRIDPQYGEICRRAMGVAGLRFGGVDLICNDISQFDEDHRILELNASPGLQNFYAETPSRQSDVRQLYKDVILEMGR